MKYRDLIEPTEEEDAEINKAIAEDPDTWEATAEDFKRAKTFHELDPELQDMLLRARLPGRPPKPDAEKKTRVNVTLDREVHEALKRKAAEQERGGASTYINALLRRELKLDAAS